MSVFLFPVLHSYSYALLLGLPAETALSAAHSYLYALLLSETALSAALVSFKPSSQSTMPSAITPILPFYDVCSSAPLPCAPIPTDQQELWGKITQPSGLLADEVLTPSHLDAPHHRASLSPSPLSAAPQFKLAAAKSPARILSPAPYRKPLKPARGLSKALDMSDEGSSSESSDSGSTLSTISEESDSKIPKPPGEPGRPGRGGYNLETALGWKLKTYSKLKVIAPPSHWQLQV